MSASALLGGLAPPQQRQSPNDLEEYGGYASSMVKNYSQRAFLSSAAGASSMVKNYLWYLNHAKY